MSLSLSANDAYARLGLPAAALMIDVRSEAERVRQPRVIPGAVLRDPQHIETWGQQLPHASIVVTYCATGTGASPAAAQKLSSYGYAAHVLDGGLAAWIKAELPTVRIRNEFKAPGGSRWITRERPKIDRLACPWLIRRFIDPEAQFFYTAPHRVRADAIALRAEPYDITDVTFSHRGPRCSFDAFLDEFELRDPVLNEVADIVRAADTGRLDQSREAPGLLAISLGLSANVPDDILLLQQALPVYDALYAWRKKASHETHSWPQPTAAQSAASTN